MPREDGLLAAASDGKEAPVPPQRWVLPAVAAGGMLGAGARFGLEQAWPTAGDALPWATLGINVSGCLLIGVLMVHVAETGSAHPLLRPLLGVGVLGGYTTFSTYAVQTRSLIAGGHPALALTYLVGTAVGALVAVAVGLFAARAVVRARRRRRSLTALRSRPAAEDEA